MTPTLISGGGGGGSRVIITHRVNINQKFDRNRSTAATKGASLTKSHDTTCFSLVPVLAIG